MKAPIRRSVSNMRANVRYGGEEPPFVSKRRNSFWGGLTPGSKAALSAGCVLVIALIAIFFIVGATSSGGTHKPVKKPVQKPVHKPAVVIKIKPDTSVGAHIVIISSLQLAILDVRASSVIDQLSSTAERFQSDLEDLNQSGGSARTPLYASLSLSSLIPPRHIAFRVDEGVSDGQDQGVNVSSQMSSMYGTYSSLFKAYIHTLSALAFEVNSTFGNSAEPRIRDSARKLQQACDTATKAARQLDSAAALLKGGDSAQLTPALDAAYAASDVIAEANRLAKEALSDLAPR